MNNDMFNSASAQSIPKNSYDEDKEHEKALERAGKVWYEVSARKIKEQKAALEKLKAQANLKAPNSDPSVTKGGRRKRKRTHKKNKKPNKLHKKTRRH
jgi:hypothetical protein